MKISSYPEYIKSEWWKLQSKLYKDKKCAQCGRTHELDVHHLTYENVGNEKPADLITLCRRCHRDLHYYKNRTNPTKKMFLRQYQITQQDWDKFLLNFS